MIEIRPSTLKDIEEISGSKANRTVKSLSVFRDNELVCIAGVTIERDNIEAFSDIKDGVSASKITIWRTAKKLVDYIRGFNLPAVAITSNGKFLESLGFSYVGDHEEKKIYKL